MSSIIKCPLCHGEFVNEPLEEILNPTVNIIRHRQERSSWYDIAEAIRSGHSYRVVEVGDSVSCTLKDGTAMSFDVVAINPYESNEVAFVATDCLTETRPMNERNTNAGGFCQSGMSRYLNSDFIKLLPDELVDVIKPRTIVQRNSQGEEFTFTGKIWLPSYTELFGTEYPSDVGDVHFPFFKDEKSRVKCINGSTAYWWERSPGYSNRSSFCGVNTGGGAGSYYAYGACGVAPAFLI